MTSRVTIAELICMKPAPSGLFESDLLLHTLCVKKRAPAHLAASVSYICVMQNAQHTISRALRIIDIDKVF